MAKHNKKHITVSIHDQVLALFQGDNLLKKYAISTAKNGPGEAKDSECTPRGLHRVHSLIGDGLSVNSVLVGRAWTGEIYTEALKQTFPNRDWILTRIVRLEGMEPGLNQGGLCDSFERYIYLHGTPDTVKLGKPGPRGCIRMRNEDILELVSLIDVGTPLMIQVPPLEN